MKNKRGQFYLVAAIILVLAVSGIIGTKTYTVSSTPEKKLTEINDELSEEGFWVVDYGLYHDDGKTNLDDFINDKFKTYFTSNLEDSTITFVYENSTEDIVQVTYEPTDSGTVSAQSGTTEMSVATTGYEVKVQNVVESAGRVIVNIEGIEEPYTITRGENQLFYFVIVQTKNGEKYIQTNAQKSS
jgi:hypothetical protein